MNHSRSQRLTCLSALTAACLFALFTAPVQAITIQIDQVATVSGGLPVPQISGDNFVWRDGGRHQEIFFSDGVTSTDLTDTPSIQMTTEIAPQISGDNVVWQSGGVSEIMYHDGQTATSISDSNFENRYPEISGENATWSGYNQGGDFLNGSEIFVYDGSTRTRVTNNSHADREPQISGDQVVWYGTHDPQGFFLSSGSINGNEIYLHDMGSGMTTQLTNNDIADQKPQIDGNYVAWQGGHSDLDLGTIFMPAPPGHPNSPEGYDQSEIYLYDGVTTTQITDNDFADQNPQVSDGNLTWRGYDGNDWEIFHYNGTEVIQLTDNDYSDSDPQISGDYVVWTSLVDSNSTDSAVFLYDGETTHELANGLHVNNDPQIDGNKVIWSGYDESHLRSIFVATIADDPCGVGDANCDGSTDLDDILAAVSSFSGPCRDGVDCLGDSGNSSSSFQMTRSEGDVNSGPSSSQGDGDVDLDDIIEMVSAFNVTEDSEGGAAAAGDSGLPDLIYNPLTGEVFLDGSDIGGGLQAYNIKNAGGGILNGGFTAILGGPPATDLPTEIGEFQLSSTATPPGGLSIGMVFPTGMDLAALSAFVTGGSAAPSFGGGSFAWELFVTGPTVPEPSTYALALLGMLGVGMMGRRRKKTV